MMVAAIQVEQLSKHYGRVQALAGVSLEIAPGEFFGLLGPNGAGKTTLISILAGLTIASGGRARVTGFDVRTQYRDARRALGVVPQELVFDPFFTASATDFSGTPMFRPFSVWRLSGRVFSPYHCLPCGC